MKSLLLLSTMFFLPMHANAASSDDKSLSPASLQLLEAAYVGSESGVLQVLKNNADINAKASSAYLKSSDYKGPLPSIANDMAIVLAVEERHVGIVKILLEHGADPNSKGDFLGESVLDKAIFWNSQEMVKLLLQHGADPKAVNKKGETPLDLAIAELKSAEDILSDPGIAFFYPDPVGTMKRHKKVVEILKKI